MLLPLFLICLATGAAAIIAYGTHPGLAQLAHGLGLIIFTRRLEWPLIALSLVLCLVLLGLVISGRRRAWWLIGLAPVLALFVHRFNPMDRARQFVLESPEFVLPDQQPQADDSWVVGVMFEDQAYALPYWALYTTPVLFITDYDKRMILMWSPFANRATAYTVTHELKPRDLEIVTTPADTLLLMDHRLGQFIVALTGQTVKGQRPIGFEKPVPTIKTTWANWRKQHPTTKVLRGYQNPQAPMGPIQPTEPDKLVDGEPKRTLISIVDTTPPVPIPSNSVGKTLVNTSAGTTRILLLHDPTTHRLRAFDRNVKEDLFPNFVLKTNRKHPEAAMMDSDSNSWWTIDGKAIEGDLKGCQLKELPIEEDLYWGVMKYWYPQMNLVKPGPTTKP